MQAFADKINEHYLKTQGGGLCDGYAPFCKHIFVENFTSSISGMIKITTENEKFLKSAYEARRENELPVLSRWFDLKALEES